MKKIYYIIILTILVTDLCAQHYHPDVISKSMWVSNNANNGIKITTNIPVSPAGSYMRNNITLFIEGYSLAHSAPINLVVVWKMWDNPVFANYSVSSFGTYQPNIFLSTENEKVVVWINETNLHCDLHIRAHSMNGNNPNWFQDWSITNSNYSNALNPLQIPYRNDNSGEENGYYPSVVSGGVWAYSSNGIKVNTNIPISQAGSYTRLDMLFIIEGYDQYGGKSFKIDFYWSMWDGPDFDKYEAYTNGDYSPEIKLGVENEKIVFWINEQGNSINKGFHIRAFSGRSNNPIWFDNWSVQNATLADPENSLTVPLISGNQTELSYWQKNEENTLSYIEGNIGIGIADFSSDYKLAVNGKLLTEEVKVQLSENWPDFVFESNYDLLTLEEVEEHINENGHLPEIPSEVEVTEKGINLGEMDAKLLQKIEELTLYLIEQNKQNREQQERIEKLEKVNSELLKKLEKE